MTMQTVVGWDGSTASWSALEWAVRWETPGGELLLVRVIDDAAGARRSSAAEPDDAAALGGAESEAALPWVIDRSKTVRFDL